MQKNLFAKRQELKSHLTNLRNFLKKESYFRVLVYWFLTLKMLFSCRPSEAYFKSHNCTKQITNLVYIKKVHYVYGQKEILLLK